MLKAEFTYTFITLALAGCGARTTLDADEPSSEPLGGGLSSGASSGSPIHSGGTQQSGTQSVLMGGRSGAGGMTSRTSGGTSSSSTMGGTSGTRTTSRPSIGGATTQSSVGGTTSGGGSPRGGAGGGGVSSVAGSAGTTVALACTRDADCADRLACTTDRCNLLQHRCENTPNSALCNDGVFCNGQEQCVLGAGCVAGSPPCADGIACTEDTCSERGEFCSFTANDALCPISHACDPVDGCQARAFAHSPYSLFDVRLPSGRVIPIGSVDLTDIALHPNGTLFGISFYDSMVVDPNTAQTITLAELTNKSFNALDAAPDGTLYAAGGTELHTIDPLSGKNTLIASLPSGSSSSGDLAFMQGRLLLSASTSAGSIDQLLEFDFATNRFNEVGSIGYSCVYGLAAFGPTLYGLTCEGLVLRIDPDTGAGTELSRSSVIFWGATAR